MYCIQWKRARESTGEEEKGKRKGHLIMYLFSCEREQKECKCVRKKGERPREGESERDCV